MFFTFRIGHLEAEKEVRSGSHKGGALSNSPDLAAN